MTITSIELAKLNIYRRDIAQSFLQKLKDFQSEWPEAGLQFQITGGTMELWDRTGTIVLAKISGVFGAAMRANLPGELRYNGDDNTARALIAKIEENLVP